MERIQPRDAMIPPTMVVSLQPNLLVQMLLTVVGFVGGGGLTVVGDVVVVEMVVEM